MYLSLVQQLLPKFKFRPHPFELHVEWIYTLRPHPFELHMERRYMEIGFPLLYPYWYKKWRFGVAIGVPLARLLPASTRQASIAAFENTVHNNVCDKLLLCLLNGR